MSTAYKLKWDQTGERLYETGTDRGVVYPKNESGVYSPGAAWNGLTGVEESPEGAEANDFYADNIKYASIRSAENFKATIKAYTYPDEFADLDGSKEIAPGVRAGQQERGVFGLSYRTLIGNDEKKNDYGYKIHLVYGATASPSQKSYESVNDSPSPADFSWEIDTLPENVPVEGVKPTATLEINSTTTTKEKMEALEAILYGYDEYSEVTPENGDNPKTEGWYVLSGANYVLATDTTVQSGTDYYELVSHDARLPLPGEVATIMA